MLERAPVGILSTFPDSKDMGISGMLEGIWSNTSCEKMMLVSILKKQSVPKCGAGFSRVGKKYRLLHAGVSTIRHVLLMALYPAW
jgi:hypothetical protein